MRSRKSWSASRSIRSSELYSCWAPAACSPSCCRTLRRLLPPFTSAAVQAALGRLGIGRLLGGYRGRPPGDMPALVRAVLACARYAEDNVDRLLELDLNPVIVRPAGLGVVAVDALVRLARGDLR